MSRSLKCLFPNCDLTPVFQCNCKKTLLCCQIHCSDHLSGICGGEYQPIVVKNSSNTSSKRQEKLLIIKQPEKLDDKNSKSLNQKNFFSTQAKNFQEKNSVCKNFQNTKMIDTQVISQKILDTKQEKLSKVLVKDKKLEIVPMCKLFASIFPEEKAIYECLICGKLIPKTSALNHVCERVEVTLNGIDFHRISFVQYLCLKCSQTVHSSFLYSHADLHKTAIKFPNKAEISAIATFIIENDIEENQKKTGLSPKSFFNVKNQETEDFSYKFKDFSTNSIVSSNTFKKSNKVVSKIPEKINLPKKRIRLNNKN